MWVCDGNGTWIDTPTNQGIKGQTGAAGTNGDKGEQGEPGDQGNDGGKGEQGVQGIQGVQGEQGVAGNDGTDGVKGEQGEQGKSPFTFKGEVPTSGDLPNDAEEGDIWRLGSDGSYQLWNGSAWVEFSVSTDTMPEPPNDTSIYGRNFDGTDGTWVQSVKLAGDTMTGALVAPTMTVGPDSDNTNRSIISMSAAGVNYDLEADTTFLKFNNEYLAKQEDVELLQNSVVNLAETQEVIAPTELLSIYQLGASATTASGEFFPDGSTFAGTASIVLDKSDHNGADNSAKFAELTERQYITILSVSTPYGLSARIAREPKIDDVTGACTLFLDDLRPLDDPNGGMPAGFYTIKVQNLVDPKNIQEINNILDGLNGSFNNIADYRSVVMIDGNDTPPSHLPSGPSIPEGKLYFNTKYLQLYIRLGDSWLGLL